jgi:hypothetical protein
MPEAKGQATSVSAATGLTEVSGDPTLNSKWPLDNTVSPVATDAPRRKVVIINDPQGWPSEWEFERSPIKNDVIVREENGLFYKVLGSTYCGDLLLEGFCSRPDLERAFGWTSVPIKAWLRW